MTELWWCAVHRAAESAEEGTCEVMAVKWTFAAAMGVGPSNDRCGWIRKRLVPVDALVLVRDAEGNWPEWVYGIPALLEFVGGGGP